MSKEPEIKPLSDNVLIIRAKSKNQTEGGLHIPDEAKEKLNYGRVIAIGPGALMENGTLSVMHVKKDDTVYFKQFAGAELTIGNNTLVVMPQSDLLLLVD